MTEERELARQAIDRGLLDTRKNSPPRTPAKYQVLRQLGAGGAGEVFLARDRSLDRDVALKYLRFSQPGLIERFRREAQFTARLNSPSIVQIYEMDEIDGVPFIAMEYIAGKNLAEASLSLRELIAVFHDVANALQHAHANGIVHRDIKPQNILLDGDHAAHLTDFGIARNLFEDSHETLSVEGQVLGTPALMSPEQARGDQRSIDARTDVYCLGATMYRMFTGRWPFVADHVVDLLHSIIHKAPPLPRSVAPSLPRNLEEIVLRCLQKEPAARFQSMDELARELNTALAGTSDNRESNAWFRRLVGRISGKPVEPPAPEPDTDPFLTLGMEAARELAWWDTNLYRVSRDLPRAYPRLDALITRLREFLKSRPDAAWARFYLGLALFRRGHLEPAREEMERSIDRASEVPGAYFELGKLYLHCHLYEQEMARKHIDQEGVTHHLDSARDLLELAALAFREASRHGTDQPTWQLPYAEAVTHLSKNEFSKCVEICDEILAGEPDLEDVWKLRGDALRLSNREPFSSYAKALEIRRSFYEACLSEAEARMEREQWHEAEKALERTLRIHPGLPAATALLAQIQFRTAQKEADAGNYGEQILCQWDRNQEQIEAHPDHYELRLLAAQMALELPAAVRDGPLIDQALHHLEAAKHLEGCQNRVLIHEARLKLAKVDQFGSREDVISLLESILEQRNSMPAQTGEWADIFQQAQAKLQRHGNPEA